MTINIAGSGNVCLVTGACIADFDNDVLCLDLQAKKIELLKSGVVTIYELGVDDVIARNFAETVCTFKFLLPRTQRQAWC